MNPGDTAVDRAPGGLASALGVVVTRLVVPLWLLAGVVAALWDASPRHLPAALVQWLGPTGVDLGFVLRYAAAFELAVVGLIVLLPGLARPVAMAQLAAFIPVLVGDLMLGASSCGCFGAVPVPPWLTLTVDCLLLIAVWWLGGKAPSLRLRREVPTGRVVLLGLWVLLAFAFVFGIVAPSGSATAASATAVALPAEGYFVPDYQAWLGQRWTDVPISRYVLSPPPDLDQGEQYLIFYRKNCEHCHELLETYFDSPPDRPTTVIAVPERKGFPSEGVLEMPCTACRQAELPAGCDWFLKTPVMVRLDDGVVECAAEVDVTNPECIE